MSSTSSSYLATWLDACQNPNSNLSKFQTPYSESSASRSDTLLPLLLGLLQSRSEIDRILFELDMTQSLVDVETRLADMRSRFQRLVRNTRAEFWRDAAKIGIKDMPFEEIRFSETGKAPLLPCECVLTEPYPGAQADRDEDDVEEDDSDVSSDADADEVDMESDEPLRSENEDSKETHKRSPSLRHMHICHFAVSRHRVGRFIAFAKGSGSRSVIMQQTQKGAPYSTLKDGVLADTEAMVATAKTELAEETQRESKATEAYRQAMIAVLQEELTR